MRDALTVGGEVPADAPGDSRRGVLDRVPGQVRISGGRLHLGVTEKLADHREALAQGQSPRRIPVSEIVQPNVLKRALARAVC